MTQADLSPDTPRIRAAVPISHWTVELSRVAKFTVDVYDAVDAKDAAEKAAAMVHAGDVLPTGWWGNDQDIDVDSITEHPAGPRCPEED